MCILEPPQKAKGLLNHHIPGQNLGRQGDSITHSSHYRDGIQVDGHGVVVLEWARACRIGLAIICICGAIFLVFLFFWQGQLVEFQRFSNRRKEAGIGRQMLTLQGILNKRLFGSLRTIDEVVQWSHSDDHTEWHNTPDILHQRDNTVGRVGRSRENSEANLGGEVDGEDALLQDEELASGEVVVTDFGVDEALVLY